ncbi:DUF6477 family protein [Paracoccus sp. (in: a-proteobacteria)]|uniref:DUF6477 family protein n=1 Tax=Paracoccus sp. TaxID=267 RepID=UPI0026DFDE90|nr:DUF6477 family protein [Paracoccus sp. (in: a-proteobacteria)]MDO5646492.1 DUF6477 family protein [Paracoccus sp. (in: a-proteobacteria)]
MTNNDNVIAFPMRRPDAPLRRPAVLIRAAKAGQSGWRRLRDLPRLLRMGDCPAPGQALARLRAAESLMNDARLERRADYDMQQHVLLMIAILAEMRAVAQITPQRAAS